MKGLSFFGKQSKSVSWESSLGILLASLVGVGSQAYADIPSGIIGGQTLSSDAYGALVFYPSGSISSISSPGNGTIFGVAINPTGSALIGGQLGGTSGYGAAISSGGVVTPLSLSLPAGTISSVAINLTGQGIIGGSDNNSNSGYAALVAPDGTVTPLTLDPTHSINSVALNDAGVGLIGGEGGTGGTFTCYAAYVASDGTVTAIPNLPIVAPDHILTVAINDLGNGIIGGFQSTGGYAAFVVPGGSTPTEFTLTNSNQIYGVAINHSGMGLVGGVDVSFNAYAGYATPDGTFTPLFTSPFTGTILSVAMNDTGAGIIGGQSGPDLYAAFVLPDGTITPITPPSLTGGIYSVAINEAGVGLIGGYNDSIAYSGLVAPNGTLTLFDMSSQVTINAVALNNSLTDAATPTSAGSVLSTTYTQLAAASTLDYRFVHHSKAWSHSPKSKGDSISVAYNEMNLLASNDPNTLGANSTESFKPNEVWVAPFGNYVNLTNQGKGIPNYTNEIGGVLAGYDYQGSNYMVGAALGYAFDYVKYSQGLGHSKINEELACFYGSYYRDHFRLSGALWGGLYQLSTTRHTLSIITSKGHTHGWILSPHIEMATPWAMDQKQRYFVEPFFMLDWVNSWQNHFTESGAAGFNLKMGNFYGSLLQSEVGLRFYEQFTYGWGDFLLEEKLSYINQAPFHFNSTTTSFVGSASTFPIAAGSSKLENLGALQVTGTFVPQNKAYPFGGFSAQASAGSSYQSYFGSVFVGMNF